MVPRATQGKAEHVVLPFQVLGHEQVRLRRLRPRVHGRVATSRRNRNVQVCPLKLITENTLHRIFLDIRFSILLPQSLH